MNLNSNIVRGLITKKSPPKNHSKFFGNTPSLEIINLVEFEKLKSS